MEILTGPEHCPHCGGDLPQSVNARPPERVVLEVTPPPHLIWGRGGILDVLLYGFLATVLLFGSCVLCTAPHH